MAKIIKATDAQKEEYLKTKPVYPLYGYVTISGKQCAIEDLRGSDPDVKYEVCAPTGYIFEQHDLHNLMCVSVADMKDQLDGVTLTECARPCSWCGAK